jgi:hypothetical protein
VGAKVQGIKDRYDGFGICNFAVANFELSDAALALLLNVIHPIVAFAKPPIEGQVIFDYVDCPKLAEAFRSFGPYSIANSAELSQQLVHDMCKDLAPAEIKSVRYFRPSRVGEVIFNYWD